MSTKRHLRATPELPGLPTEMKVLYLIDSLRHGGAEQLMATWLPRVRDLGILPVVGVLQRQDGNPLEEPLRDAGISVVNLNVERLRQRDALDQVLDLTETVDPDLIHAQLEFSTILGTRAAKDRGVPSVVTIHTIDDPSVFTRDGLRFRLMTRALRTRADRVVTVSKRARNHIVAKASVPRDRVVAVWNGIDLKPYRAQQAYTGAIRDELGIPLEAPLAITVAVLREPKGVQYMLDAMASMTQQVPNAHYLVIGDGDYRGALEERAQQCGVSDRVVFAGRRDDVPALLAASDVFVLPSLTEALPTVVIEAMAASRPVVATSVGGIPEMVDSGVSALLVEPRDAGALADAVGRVLANPMQATAMGHAGSRLATERFDVARQAAFLRDEYRHLIARTREAVA